MFDESLKSAAICATGKLLVVDLTDAEKRLLDAVAEDRGVSAEVAAGELLSERIKGEAQRGRGRRVSMSASVVAFHRAVRARDEESGR